MNEGSWLKAEKFLQTRVIHGKLKYFRVLQKIAGITELRNFWAISKSIFSAGGFLLFGENFSEKVGVVNSLEISSGEKVW